MSNRLEIWSKVEACFSLLQQQVESEEFEAAQTTQQQLQQTLEQFFEMEPVIAEKDQWFAKVENFLQHYQQTQQIIAKRLLAVSTDSNRLRQGKKAVSAYNSVDRDRN